MALKNIELFDLLIPYLASELYEAFPLCKNINLANILENEELKNVDLPEKEKVLILSEAIFWLEENSFLLFSAPSKRPNTGVAYPAFKCVRLTAKGINILKSTPSSMINDKSIGQKINESVQKQIINKVPELAFNLLQKIGEI